MSPVARLLQPLLFAAALLAQHGAAARELSLPGLDGATHTLAEWRGRTVLLSFWATWCEPCIAEIPHLAALEKRHRDQGLRIVSVGIDAKEKLSNVVRTLDIRYPVLVADPDRARELLAQWGDRRGVVPYLVLIDPSGRVLATHLGPIDEEGLAELVRPRLQ